MAQTSRIVHCCCVFAVTVMSLCWWTSRPASEYTNVSSAAILFPCGGGGARGGGAVAQWIRALAWTGDWTLSAGFEYHCGKLCFGTLAIPFTPLCQCLSEETLKAVGPFYLVSMPGKYKIPPVHTGMCNCCGLHHC